MLIDVALFLPKTSVIGVDVTTRVVHTCAHQQRLYVYMLKSQKAEHELPPLPNFFSRLSCLCYPVMQI